MCFKMKISHQPTPEKHAACWPAGRAKPRWSSMFLCAVLCFFQPPPPRFLEFGNCVFPGRRRSAGQRGRAHCAAERRRFFLLNALPASVFSFALPAGLCPQFRPPVAALARADPPLAARVAAAAAAARPRPQTRMLPLVASALSGVYSRFLLFFSALCTGFVFFFNLDFLSKSR